MPGAWHWAVALIASLGAHAALLATLEPLPELAEERAQGLPEVVWGLTAHAVDAVDEPSTPAEARDGAEEAREAEEAVEEPDAPDETAETSDSEVADESEVVVEHDTAHEIMPEAEIDAERAEAEFASVPEIAGPVVDSPAEPPAEAIAEASAEQVAESETESEAEPEARTADEARPQETAQAVPLPQRKPDMPSQRRRATAPAQRASPSGGPAGEAVGERGRQVQTAGRADVSDYSGRVLAHLRRHQRYPRDAQRAGAQGTVRLTFSVGTRGELRGARIVGASGHAALDREALAMVRRAAPYPPIPSGLQRSNMTFTVPIRFSR